MARREAGDAPPEGEVVSRPDDRDFLAVEAVDAAADAALAASDALFRVALELRRDSCAAGVYGWAALGGERWRSLVALAATTTANVAELAGRVDEVFERKPKDARPSTLAALAARIVEALAIAEEKKRAALLLPEER